MGCALLTVAVGVAETDCENERENIAFFLIRAMKQWYQYGVIKCKESDGSATRQVAVQKMPDHDWLPETLRAA